MNERRHFFGAFAEVKVRRQERSVTKRQCVNGHNANRGQFCSECGQEMLTIPATALEMPVHVYELLPDDLADDLAVITPASLFGSGSIVVRSNRKDETVWMEADRDAAEKPVRLFPTEAEIASMKAILSALPAIDALRNHPDVLAVNVLAGYVEDADY